MTDKAIRFAFSGDDSQFSAASQRVGKVLEGLKSIFSGTSAQSAQMAETMSAQMRSVQESVASSVTGMGGHFSGLLETLGRARGGLVALGVAAAGIAAGKAAQATAEMTESAMDLARVLGSSTNEAQHWRLALQDVGASQGELEGAAKGMSRQLRENEHDMKAMGLQTRDSAGHLRPMTELLTEGIKILTEYKEGADRSLASQTLFGRGVDASSKLLLLNQDALDGARQTAAELGLEVGENAVAAWKAYDDASDRAAFSMRGLGNTVGTIVMPVVTQLINIFNAAMPAAIVVVKGAVGGLVTAFHGLTNGVVVLWETIKAMIFSVTEPLRSLGAALIKLAKGDFKGAAEEMTQWPQRVGQYWEEAFDRMVDSAQETQGKIAAIWSTGDAAPGKPVGRSDGNRTAPPPKPAGQKKEETAPSFMTYYEAVLAQEKQLASERDAIHGMSKQAEMQFWLDIQANARLSAQDQVAVGKRIAQARIELLRQEAQEAQRIGQITLDAWQARELAKVDMAAQQAQQEVDLGERSTQQLLQQQIAFEEQRTAIRRTAIEANLAAVDPSTDPVQVAQLHAQLEGLEQQHQLRLAQIRGQIATQSAREQGAIWDDLASRTSKLWDAGVQAMMNGTLTWRNALRAVGAELTAWFAGVVKQQVVTWVKGEAAKTGATEAGVLMRWAAESWAAAKSVALWAATAVKNIMASAWEAMAAAWKAMVGIPYVGPFLAVAAAAAAFAGVSALARNVSSAEGGYDIPAGVNPMTQLHEREMVLPAKHADVIRTLADSTGGPAAALGGGGGAAPTINIKGASVGDFMLLHKADFARALQGLYRDGYLKKA